MIVTVKAWLHAEVNYKGETEYKLHSFATPLHARDVPIREISYDVIIEENEIRNSLKGILEADLLSAKLVVSDLEAKIAGVM